MPAKRSKPIVAPVTSKAISLFSGAGGDSLGIKRAEYNVVAFSEFKKPAINTHLQEFSGCPLLVCPETASADITKIPDSVFEYYKNTVELMFFGFPCQGFSNSGKKKMDDPRNELVFDCARATSIIKPKYFIGENVPGLLSRKGKDPVTAKIRPVIDIIRDLFGRIGYNITYKVLKATDFGVPQERKRLIIVGTPASSRGGGYPHMPWDKLAEPTGVKYTSIRPFLETHLEGAMEFKEENIPEGLSPHYWINTDATQATGKPHPNLLRLAGGIRNKSSKEKEAAGDGDDSQLVIQGGLISFGVRKSAYHGQILDPDLPCKTIICTYGTCPRLFVGLRNQEEGRYWVRCLSVKELAQIQGFPADYKWQGNEKEIITQIGNAVPPSLCEAVVRSLPRIVYKDVAQGSNEVIVEESDDEDDE
jgi:DNA (cytosine-5)-methyltransferase 1